jgi:hypothetical protein
VGHVPLAVRGLDDAAVPGLLQLRVGIEQVRAEEVVVAGLRGAGSYGPSMDRDRASATA